MDHVVVDVEIQKTVEQCSHGWDSTEEMGVAVACVWEYATQRMHVYGPDDVEELRSRLLKADRISGYNIFNFDFPVIWSLSKEEWLSDPTCAILKSELRRKTDDMLRRIWQALKLDPDCFDKRTHGGWSLDAVASATLGARKIGYGGDAPKWYQQGQTQRVVNYCADDVALERDLTDFVDRYGYVCNRDKLGRADVARQLMIPAWKGGN